MVDLGMIRMLEWLLILIFGSSFNFTGQHPITLTTCYVFLWELDGQQFCPTFSTQRLVYRGSVSRHLCVDVPLLTLWWYSKRSYAHSPKGQEMLPMSLDTMFPLSGGIVHLIRKGSWYLIYSCHGKLLVSLCIWTSGCGNLITFQLKTLAPMAGKGQRGGPWSYLV